MIVGGRNLHQMADYDNIPKSERNPIMYVANKREGKTIRLATLIKKEQAKRKNIVAIVPMIAQGDTLKEAIFKQHGNPDIKICTQAEDLNGLKPDLICIDEWVFINDKMKNKIRSLIFDGIKTIAVTTVDEMFDIRCLEQFDEDQLK